MKQKLQNQTIHNTKCSSDKRKPIMKTTKMHCFSSCNSFFPASQIEYKQRRKFSNRNPLTRPPCCQGNQLVLPTKRNDPLYREGRFQTPHKTFYQSLLLARCFFYQKVINISFACVFYLLFFRMRGRRKNSNKSRFASLKKTSRHFEVRTFSFF